MNVHIVSNYLPNDWWKKDTKYNEVALYRRIHVVHWHYAYKKFRLYESDPHADVQAGTGSYAMDKFNAARLLDLFVPINNNNL